MNSNAGANISTSDPLESVQFTWEESQKSLPQVSIISPTYNERTNIRPLVNAVAAAMGPTPFELIFVDDDSPDGTCEEVMSLAREGAPVRCVRRVGRRGLASAVVEGAMAANSEVIAVIDADMQHDETLLPKMLAVIRSGGADLVIGSRHVEGGSLGEWSNMRRFMSDAATKASTFLIGSHVSDPMSGFFMTKRAVFDRVIYNLSQQGYKILLDILTSSGQKLKVVEIPYTFRLRHSGESKIDVMIVLEYAFLLIEKLTRGLIPPRFVLFALVGGLGLIVHLSVLELLKSYETSFLSAQAAATLVAMGFNFLLNNQITYRSDRLKGFNLIWGFMVFSLACSIGAIANVSVASLMHSEFHSWPIAGIAGALMSSVFNFGVASRFVWGKRRTAPRVSVEVYT